MTKVAVIPPAPALAGNALFEGRRLDSGAHAPNSHWMDGFAAVRQLADAQGIEMATDDILPVERADVVVHMAFPADPHLVVGQKRRHPGLKAVLVLIETAMGARYTFNPRNHDAFDAIITYDERLVDGRRYFPMRPRAYDRDRIRQGLPFSERRVGCLVGTNRPLRRRSGLGVIGRGWWMSRRDWADYVFCPGHLIDYRAEVGRLCASAGPGIFDLYGDGWDSDPATRAACLGIPAGATIDYIGRYRFYMAFENHTGAHSLISERIWDALWGDAVPVYRGNTRLDRHIPREAFVDAGAFASPAALMQRLVTMSEAEWTALRQAGREFITGSAVEPFLPYAFAGEFLQPIAALAAAARVDGV